MEKRIVKLEIEVSYEVENIIQRLGQLDSMHFSEEQDSLGKSLFNGLWRASLSAIDRILDWYFSVAYETHKIDVISATLEKGYVSQHLEYSIHLPSHPMTSHPPTSGMKTDKQD